MITDIEVMLKNVLILKIKQIKEARIDGVHENNFQIMKVEYIQPVIVSPRDILNEDFTRANEIQFHKGKIRVSKQDAYGVMESMYYFDGQAKITFQNNEFLIETCSITIYTN